MMSFGAWCSNLGEVARTQSSLVVIVESSRGDHHLRSQSTVALGARQPPVARKGARMWPRPRSVESVAVRAAGVDGTLALEAETMDGARSCRISSSPDPVP